MADREGGREGSGVVGGLGGRVSRHNAGKSIKGPLYMSTSMGMRGGLLTWLVASMTLCSWLWSVDASEMVTDGLV